MQHFIRARHLFYSSLMMSVNDHNDTNKTVLSYNLIGKKGRM